MSWTNDIEVHVPLDQIVCFDWGYVSVRRTLYDWYSIDCYTRDNKRHHVLDVQGAATASQAQFALRRRLDVFRRLTR